jgi:hypothetical protein
MDGWPGQGRGDEVERTIGSEADDAEPGDEYPSYDRDFPSALGVVVSQDIPD